MISVFSFSAKSIAKEVLPTAVGPEIVIKTGFIF